MALTITTLARINRGNKNERLIQITLDSSYPTGGYAFDKNTMGLGAPGSILQFPTVIAVDATPAAYLIVYDYTNKKILVFWANAVAGLAPFTQVTNATNLSAITFRVPVLFGP